MHKPPLILSDLSCFIEKRVISGSIKSADQDVFRNGIILAHTSNVNGVWLCTTARVENIEFFYRQGINTVISHHSVELPWWEMAFRCLVERWMNLLTYHRPLDIDVWIGNNHSIIRMLELSYEKFEVYEWGLVVQLRTMVDIAHIVNVFSEQNFDPVLLSYGASAVQRIGIVSWGGASEALEYFVVHGVDVFITGEITERAKSWTMDLCKSYIALDHYRSELTSLRILGKLLQQQYQELDVYIR